MNGDTCGQGINECWQIRGSRLRSVRELAGLSGQIFATTLHISVSDLNLMETGRADLDHQTLTALFYEYQISPLFMLTGEGQRLLVRRPDSNADTVRTEKEIERSILTMRTMQLSLLGSDLN